MKGGATTCNPLYPTTGSLDQGAQFAKMTTSFHGGAKKVKNAKKQSKSNKNGRKNRKMVRGTRRMRGGALFTPYADYPTSFTATLPTELHDSARVASLDAKFTELPDVMKAHGVQLQAGGGRRRSHSRRGTRKHRGGQADIGAPTTLLSTPAEEAAARLNPQWYNENTVVPEFRGWVPVPGQAPSAPLPPKPAAGGAKKNKSKSRSKKNVKKNRRTLRR